jgi:radical SAM protein with 4Fe4S-binding SPASM domain
MPSGRKTDLERGPFLVLEAHCALKRLETPCIHDLRADQLYELDEEACSFLASSPSLSSAVEGTATAELARYCLDEGLLRTSETRHPLPTPERPPLPTLRYLLVHITDRCNLRCRHCFIGSPSGEELALGQILELAGEFARLQGLRFIVSGGEPLRHPRFRELNERLTDFSFRSILLTNGTLIDRAAAAALRFHEVQVSLDGMEDTHDLIRGRGSFRRAIQALRHLAGAGISLSVATMVHAANLDQLDELRLLLEEFPLKSWSVDVPCLTGNMADNPLLAAPPEKAAGKMSLSFGGGYYGSSGPYACGAHLAAVMADGSICKCGHYAKSPEGRIGEGLETVWRRMRRFRLKGLACRCSQLESCRGGCRFRAELYSCISGPDPIQCLARGMPLGGDLKHPSQGQPEARKGGENS